MAEAQSNTASPCAALDTMPNEIQQMIYRHILRADRSVVRQAPRAQRTRLMSKRAFNTALFTVCKQVSANALTTFFDENVIRITKNEKAPYLDEARAIEVTGDYAAAICRDQNLDQAKVRGLLRLPKIQILVIDVGALAARQQTVRNFVGRSTSWKSLTCIGIGSFELELGPQWTAGLHQVHLRDFRPVEVLPEALRLVAEHGYFEMLHLKHEYLLLWPRTEYYVRDVIGYDLAGWILRSQDRRVPYQTRLGSGLSVAADDAADGAGPLSSLTDGAVNQGGKIRERVRLGDLLAGGSSLPLHLEEASDLVARGFEALVEEYDAGYDDRIFVLG